MFYKIVCINKIFIFRRTSALSWVFPKVNCLEKDNRNRLIYMSGGVIKGSFDHSILLYPGSYKFSDS